MTPAFSVGVRLHDLPEGSVEQRIRMAGELGFACIQLPSKVLYQSSGIGREGLTRELACRLREVLGESGVHVAVLGCYKNLATPDAAQLADNLGEYRACLRFAGWLGGCPVGTETGRPNPKNAVADDRFGDVRQVGGDPVAALHAHRPEAGGERRRPVPQLAPAYLA